MRDKASIANGDTVVFTVTAENDAATACDVTGASVVVHCPAADGTPTGAATTCATNADFLVPFPPTTLCTVACTVTFNPGIISTQALLDGSGTPHDNPDNDPGMTAFHKTLSISQVPSQESPAGCSGEQINVDFLKDKTSVVSGDIVTYTVTAENDAATGCDVIGTNVVFHCPAPDGTPTGAATTCATNQDFLVPFPPTILCTVQCPVSFNPGVTSAQASLDGLGVLRDNLDSDLDMVIVHKTLSVIGRFCGDGTINDSGCNETCDTNAFPAGAPSSHGACRSGPCGQPDACTFCGDGIVNGGEQCDDGNNVDTDGCRNNCTLPTCGDGIVGNTPGETCDPPGSNAGQPNECRADCTFCGDGEKDAGEQCDDGNSIDTDGCSADCELEGEATCRTPEFWGTYAGTEKTNSVNITQAVIDAGGGVLHICREKIINTDLLDAASAVEGLCAPAKGKINLRLARQLIAASLNCIISGGGADCAGTPLYAMAFSSCNRICANTNNGNANGPARGEITSCIAELDCLNNGHIFDSGICSGSSGCHDRILKNDMLGLHFEPPGPAGSLDECKAAIDSGCTIIGPGEGPNPNNPNKCSVDSSR